MTRRRQIAWILILLVEAGYIAWGAGAAFSPEHLLGPGGRAILPAGYEGYSGASWSKLTSTWPPTASYMVLLFRLYGLYCALFGAMCAIIAVTAFRRGEPWAWWTLLITTTIALVSAMTYDRAVHAIGPFELTEYLGLALVWGALGMTAPFGTPAPRVGQTG